MAGTSDSFDADDDFRTPIREAMRMGQALDAAQRPTFRWDTVQTFASADSAGRPWNPNASPTTSTPRTPVQVLCAVEEVGGQTSVGDETTFGSIDRDRLLIILLDEEYAQVGDFDEVAVGGAHYRRRKELPPIAIFDAGVHRILVEAVDES